VDTTAGMLPAPDPSKTSLGSRAGGGFAAGEE
jgi:hypothetical protein